MTESKFSLRPMSCELNVLSVPDGSSMLMQGKLNNANIPNTSFVSLKL